MRTVSLKYAVFKIRFSQKLYFATSRWYATMWYTRRIDVCQVGSLIYGNSSWIVEFDQPRVTIILVISSPWADIWTWCWRLRVLLWRLQWSFSQMLTRVKEFFNSKLWGCLCFGFHSGLSQVGDFVCNFHSNCWSWSLLKSKCERRIIKLHVLMLQKRSSMHK